MATSVKDADFSKAGESVTQSVFSEPTAHELIAEAKKEVLPVSGNAPTGSGRVIFKLVNSRKNGRVWVDGMADIYDPVQGKLRRARLLTGVDTIWMDEQLKQGITDKYADRNRRSLCFEDRNCILKDHDKTAIQFARMSNHFIENKDRKSGSKHEFYEWNPARQEAAAYEKEILEQESMELAMSQPFDKVKKHAAFLGVSLVDELGEPRTEKGVRVLYIREARRNPDRFKKSLGSKEVEVSYLIKRNILDNKIDLGGNTGNIRWANGGHICKLPQGRNAVEFLIEMALLPNDEGKQFLEQLQKT